MKIQKYLNINHREMTLTFRQCFKWGLGGLLLSEHTPAANTQGLRTGHPSQGTNINRVLCEKLCVPGVLCV